MSDDIRLQSDWYQNPKIKKLGILVGPQGIVSLLTLWAWTGKNRPNGVLHDMDELDIILAANWPNDVSLFMDSLLKLRLLDREEPWYVIHDWARNQPWALHTEDRKSAARKAAEARWAKEGKNEKVSSQCDSHENQCESHDFGCATHESALRNMPKSDAPFLSFPSPIPSPIPNPPKEKNPPTPRKRGDEAQGTRWADDRTVPQEWKNWAKEKYPHINVEKEALKFENYWPSKPGKTAVKLNWEKTWKTWILNNEESANQHLTHNQPQAFNTGNYNGNRKLSPAERHDQSVLAYEANLRRKNEALNPVRGERDISDFGHRVA
jgi:hypothetical protein